MVGAIGWRLQSRYRTYGAALIGCGAAIIYLSVWAAARLYGVLPPTTGIVGLALVSIALAMIAYAIDVEALGTTAALGAFFAPILLGQDQANAGHAPAVSRLAWPPGSACVAARRRWRLTMFVVALSYFGVAFTGAADRGPPWGLLLYGVVGGAAGIYVGLRERWWETRFLSLRRRLGLPRRRQPTTSIIPGPSSLAGILLAAPVWWYALRTTQILPLHLFPIAGVSGWSLGEAFYFFLTPVLLGWAVYGLAPGLVRRETGVGGAHRRRFRTWLPAISGVRPVFALVGAAALGIAAWQHWDGVERVWALLALTLLWAALDHPLKREDGRWFALATLWAALDQLFTGRTAGSGLRPSPPSWGRGRLALWGTVAVAAGARRGTLEIGGSRPTSPR